MNSNVEQVRQGATGLGEAESIVVMGRRHSSGYETEGGFVECLQERLASRSLAVHSEAEIADELYPWFEPRTAPQTPRDLEALLEWPTVRDAFERRQVRYIVWVDGSTNTTDKAGSLSCTISPGGGGCFGFMTWDRDSRYEATIWDLRELRTVGHIASDVSGTSYMPAVVVPVPLIARVQASACKSLGAQLESFIVGDPPQLEGGALASGA